MVVSEACWRRFVGVFRMLERMEALGGTRRYIRFLSGYIGGFFFSVKTLSGRCGVVYRSIWRRCYVFVQYGQVGR